MKQLFSDLVNKCKEIIMNISQNRRMKYVIIASLVVVVLVSIGVFAAFSMNEPEAVPDPIPEYDKVSVLGGGNGKSEATETTDSHDTDDESEPSEVETDDATSDTDENTSSEDDETASETKETAGGTIEPDETPSDPSEDNVEPNEPVEIVPSVPAATNNGEHNAGLPASTTSKTTQTGPKPTPTTTKATQAEPKPTPTTTKQAQAEPKPTPTTTKQAQTEPKPTPTTTQKPQSNPGEILGTWTVKEKKYDYNGANVMILDVENQSSSPYTITLTGHFKDASGKEIRTETKTFEGFPANYQNYFVFQPGVKFDSFSYDFVTSAYSGPAYLQYITCGNDVEVKDQPSIIDSNTPGKEPRAEIMVTYNIRSSCSTVLYYIADFVLFDNKGEIFWIENKHGGHGIGLYPSMDNGEKKRGCTLDDILYKDFVMPGKLKSGCTGLVAIIDIADYIIGD